MKNFRKVLALILVVATLFSFVAMASAKNAAEYADYDEIQNVIPVEVISALGITEGYDGKYHPADTIDRDEVAAMVARLRNGGAFDPTYYVGADNVFADVKGQWSEGYVTYCAQLGIIAGRNASTFDPDGQVTIVEVAKMLLCVLGWDAAEQGYVGTNWKVAVVRDAEKMGLLANIAAADVFEPATRDQVAQMFFNALSAKLVYGYVSENIAKLTNSLLGVWVDEQGQTKHPSITLPEIADAKYELAYNNAVISDTTLAEILGVTSKAGYDCFGRPGTIWTVGSWSKFFKADPAAKSTDGTNPFGADAIAEVYHNGKSVDVSKAASLLGKGVLAERYGNRLVLIDTYFTTVTAINNRTGIATLAEGAKVSAAGLYVGAVVKVHTCDGTCIADATKRQSTDEVLECDDHDGAYVHANAYTVVEGQTITVDETHYVNANAANSYVIAKDGKTYEYAKYLGHELVIDNADARDNGQMAWSAKGKDKVVYFDDYGYIQYWTNPAAAAGAPDQVLYLLSGTNTAVMNDTYVDAALEPTYTFTADAIDMDAEEVNDLAITKDTYETMVKDEVAEGVNPYNTGILALVTAGGAIKEQAVYAARNTYLDATKGELVNEKAPNGLNYHFDANTKFLVRTWDLATGKASYTAVTGYKAMPEYLSKVVFATENKNTVQYIDLDVGEEEGDGYIDYLFIDAFYAKATSEYIYITERVEEIGVAALGNLYHEISYYKAYVNGEVAYVAYFYVGGQYFEDNWTGKALEPNTLYKAAAQSINATYNDAPIYVAMTEAKEVVWAEADQYSDIVVKNGQIELYVDGALSDIYSAEYLDDLTVYVVSDATDVVAGAYTGAKFVEKYQTGEYFVDTTVDVYGLGNPVNTLVLKIK